MNASIIFKISGFLLFFSVVSLTSVKDNNRHYFDFHPAVHTAEADQTDVADFYSITASPAKVASGDMIHIQAVFSVNSDSSQTIIPVDYYYEIQQRNVTVFKSPTKKMQADAGAKSVLDIQVKTAGNHGDYTLLMHLRLPEGTAQANTDFSIVSPEEAHAYAINTGLIQSSPLSRKPVGDKLLGKWQFVSSDPETLGPELTIMKKNGELAARLIKENTKIHWVKLRQTGNRLVLRSKSEDTAGNCWYVIEDMITFNESMDNMPVRSRVVEGGRCVSVGSITESMLHRVD